VAWRCSRPGRSGADCRGWAGNPQPSEAEADIEFKTVTRQLEQARQQEEAMAGRLTELESEAAAVSRSLAETAARIQSREAMVTAGEEQLQQIEAEEQELLAGIARARTP
jgi:septal ring factor EnvC (AmiA/AmiB activator)